MKRIAVRGAWVALVVLSVTAWLVVRAVQGVRDQEAARHAGVAEDLFDELERELSELVDTEERRSFLEYRHLYVPDGLPIQGTVGLVRSPLAAVPEDPAVVGYFQLDPGGGCSNPALPRDNELDAAVASGWQATDELDQRQVRIQTVLGQIPTWEAPRPLLQPEPVQQMAQLDQQQLAPKVQLKRGASSRGTRVDQVFSTGQLNVEAYNTKEDVLRNIWDANSALVPDEEEVDVRVSPIEGLRVDEHLVLHREVRIGPELHRQGLVLDVDQLASGLQQEVLSDSELEPFVTLTWSEAPESARYVFEHGFAEPFQSLTASASVARIPELSSSEPWVLGGLATLVVLVLVVGGAGVWRSVRAEVELAQRRTDFAAAVTHELKTPLTTIRMYGEMLRDGVVQEPERQQEYHSTLVSEAERLSRLVGNVLELARIERGGPGPALDRVDSTDIVREVARMCGPLIESSGATLELGLPDRLPEVQVDQDGLVQALGNLIENAVKFTSEAVDRRVHLTAQQEGKHVAFRVRDHGPGVPRGQMGHIFEPFYRGERELTRRTRGTGIGLALVQGVMERAGGTVEARNDPDGGLEVTLLLPAA